MADDVLRQASGDHRPHHGHRDRQPDFADVRTIMRDAGSALMGISVAQSENAAEPAQVAVGSPLLESSIEGGDRSTSPARSSSACSR